MRLGILTSHPIQYQTPWFRALAKEADLEVFFAHRQSAIEQGKAGFGIAFDWDVDLLSGYSHRFLQNKSAQPGVNHYAGCDTPQIAADIAQGKFEAFIVTGWFLKSYWQAVRACQRNSIPVLVRGDSQLLTPRSVWKQVSKFLTYRILLRQFTGFLVVGKRNREYLSYYGVPDEKMFFVPHFVDNDWFAQGAQEIRGQRLEIRSNWGADENTLVILFVGKFIKEKRPGDPLRALSLLKEKGIQATGVFVGAGELEMCLRAYAERSGVAAKFIGFKNQTELPACYASADLLALPSGSETWGLVVNEAMACGVPAVVSDAVGCAPDLIEPGETGFTFPAGDSTQLAERLATMAALKQSQHDFAPALADKMRTYSLKAAVRGTLRAVEVSAARM